MKSRILMVLAVSAVAAQGAAEFDVGADLRIRQEIMHDVPGLPGGGYLSKAAYGKTKNHVRFRPRVWAELKADEHWRLYTRLTDEFRANIVQPNDPTVFPDELVVDNLYVEGKALFDGFLDMTIGRRDMWGYAGLPRLFVDGTPGDGSRTIFSDMVTTKLNFTEEESLDLFALMNGDDNQLRWGTDRSNHRSLASRNPKMKDRNEWGYGAVWSGKAAGLPYKLFAMSKKTEHEDHTETVGAQLTPQIDEELGFEFEAMSQLNHEWSGYAAIDWKSAREGWKPFARESLHVMSARWDPMWARAVNDSEMFLYGTHNGVGWWSNMAYLKTTLGLEFSKGHSVWVAGGPMFAYEDDGLGAGGGNFKGGMGQAKYSFPIVTDLLREGRGLDVFGHVLVELFQPGDYFESDRLAWFVRWQLDFRF